MNAHTFLNIDAQTIFSDAGMVIGLLLGLIGGGFFLSQRNIKPAMEVLRGTLEIYKEAAAAETLVKDQVEKTNAELKATIVEKDKTIAQERARSAQLERTLADLMLERQSLNARIAVLEAHITQP